MITRLRSILASSSFLRFLISGALNTGATYAIYLLSLNVLGYKVAYTIAYVSGIALAFLFNRLFVFKTTRGWSTALLFPFVYLAQYLLSLCIIWAWVERFNMPKELAPLIAIVGTIPLTFILSKVVFGKRKNTSPTAI